MALLLEAAAKKTRFSVIAPEGLPSKTGYEINDFLHSQPGIRVCVQEILSKAGIPVSVILDSAVAHVMERVDMVLVGATAVTENGGIISQVALREPWECY